MARPACRMCSDDEHCCRADKLLRTRTAVNPFTYAYGLFPFPEPGYLGPPPPLRNPSSAELSRRCPGSGE